MPIVDVRNIPTVVEFAPDNKVVEFTEEAVTAEVVVGPTVVEFSWGELVPGPGLRGGGVFEGTVHIDQDIPSLPNNSEPIDPTADYLMLYDASSDTHVKVLANFSTGGGGGITEIPWATREETDAGILTDKALNPDVGAYAYDRFRHAGQHSAGKGTQVVTLAPVGTVVTVDQQLSNVFDLPLNDNYSMANPRNPINGQTVNVLIRQPVTGGKTITSWGSAWTFVNKINPEVTTDPNAVDLLSCQWDPTSSKMRCSYTPNYGSGFTAPDLPTAADLVFTNVGGGNEIYRDTTGLNVNFRTVVGSGDIDVTTSGDTIVVNYTAPVATTVEVLNDLTDVDAATPQDGDNLQWSTASNAWIPVANARKWAVGATWSNGSNLLTSAVNKVNAVVVEDAIIESWYVITDASSGSCVIDVRRVPIGEYPPLSTDTICGGEKPTLTAQTAATDPALTAWDVNCTAGDILQFVLESTSNFTMVQIMLVLRKVA